MVNFFKIENGYPQVGSGILVPDGFTKYTIGDEPKELIDALANMEAEDNAKTTAESISKVRDESMLLGFLYKSNGVDYQCSVTKDDGDGLMQVKASFDFGLPQTVIHFKNGTKLPMTANEFVTFAKIFVTERGKFFQ